MNIQIDKITIAPHVQGLIFDLDGTLADTMPIHYLAWQEISKKYNFIFTEDLFYELAGIPTNKMILMLNKIFSCNMDPVIAAMEKEEAFFKNFNNIELIEPVMQIVRRYYNKLPMAIGSGGRKQIVQKTVRTLGLDNYFTIVVTADDVTNHKPHPETFLKCAEQMGIEARFCQVFEDGIQGLTAAQSANMLATDIRPFI